MTLISVHAMRKEIIFCLPCFEIKDFKSFYLFLSFDHFRAKVMLKITVSGKAYSYPKFICI